MKPNARRTTLAGACGLGVIVDRATKLWAEQVLARHEVVSVLDGYLELRRSHNRGAFFSWGANLPGALRVGLFLAATLAALAYIAHLLRHTPETQSRQRWALTLLASGAIGNAIDRALHGEVTDFLHLHLREVFHWATFNVADILIAAGLGLVVVDAWAAARNAKP
jgi:signal peptidase II